MRAPLLLKLLEEQSHTTVVFRRNVIKEYLQILSLSFLYSHPAYQNLIFYGGSCLRHCFDLPRLSEDLDFIALHPIDKAKLAHGLKEFFKKELDIKVRATVQKFRIYLKFPVLHELKLADKHESNLLFLKIELFEGFTFCKGYQIETIPLFRYGKSLLIKTLDLSTLMSTKLQAIFHRKWEKTSKTGEMLARVKGRDYFDLMWYLGRGVSPNLDCLGDHFTRESLREKLLDMVHVVDAKSIQYDLEGLIADQAFLRNLSKEIKSILEREIRRKL